MSKNFTEGRLRFDFGNGWQVEKYDAHRDYRQKICKLAGSRAVDFIGLHAVDDLFFIEVKDFRDARIKNKRRLQTGELAVEVATKVRDTIAGIVAAYRRSTEPATWQPYVQALAQAPRRIRVVLWIEEDRVGSISNRSARRRAVSRSTITKMLKGKLHWLTTRVAVVDRRQIALPDLEVTNLSMSSDEMRSSNARSADG